MPYNVCYSYNIKQDEEISFPITVNKAGQKRYMRFQRHTEQCLEDLNKIESIWILLAHIFFIRFTQNIGLLSITAL